MGRRDDLLCVPSLVRGAEEVVESAVGGPVAVCGVLEVFENVCGALEVFEKVCGALEVFENVCGALEVFENVCGALGEMFRG